MYVARALVYVAMNLSYFRRPHLERAFVAGPVAPFTAAAPSANSMLVISGFASSIGN